MSSSAGTTASSSVDPRSSAATVLGDGGKATAGDHARGQDGVSNSKESRLYPAAMVFLVLFATAIRLIMARRSGFWGDECLFLFVARLPTVGDILNFLHWHESHPPFFYLVMRAWMAICGSSDTSILIPPVAFSVAIVVAVYGIGKRVFGQPAGLTAAVLVAVSSALAEYGVLVRPYSLLQLLALVSAYLLWKAVRNNSTADWVIYSLVSVLLPYTHNWGWLVLSGNFIAASLCILYRRDNAARRLGSLVVSYVLVVLLIAPWLPAVIYQAMHAGHSPLNYDILIGKTSGKLGLKLDRNIVLAGIGIVVVSGLAFVSWASMRRRGQAIGISASSHRDDITVGYWIFLCAPILSIVIASVLSIHSDMMKMRCLLIVLPCFLLVTGRACSSALRHRETRKIPAVVGLLALLFVVGRSLQGLNSLRHSIKSNARELARQLDQKVASDDLIVIARNGMRPRLTGLKDPVPEIAYPYVGREEARRYNDLLQRYDSAAAYRDIRSRIEDARRQGKRIWLITDANTKPPLSVETADTLTTDDWYNAGYLRRDQLYALLQALYGSPVPNAVDPDNRTGAELEALLFEARPAPGEPARPGVKE